MYQNLAMDRRNQVDHQRSDLMDHRKDDNDELERMPLLYCIVAVVVVVVVVVLRELDSRSWIVEMYDSNMNTHSFIYRREANEIDFCSTIANVLEYSCLIVVVPDFSFLSLLFFAFCLCLSSPFFSILLRDIDGDGRYLQQRKRVFDILVHNKCQEAVLPSFKNAFRF